jgi:CBS domain containing-hemolysin-like protein
MFNLLSIVILILSLDAIVSASEAAIFTVPVNRARLLAEKGPLGKTLLKLKESMERPITTLIALSNLITIGGSVFVGTVARDMFGSEGLGMFAAVLTFIVMIFGEIVPKRLGERYAEFIALAAAPLVRVLAVAFTPLIRLINAITEPLTLPKRALTSEEEIAFLARVGGKEGAIEPDEAELIGRVFKLNDITAGDMMTPLPSVLFIDGEEKIGEAAKFIQTAGHTRLPVYAGNKNNVIGVAHQRDLLRAIARGETERLVKEFAREALVVPDSRLGDDLLRDFQRSRSNLAIVVSDYGNVVGVVGLEDVMEELVGEIVEEKDVAPETIKRVSKSEIVVHGQTPIAAINHFFNLDIKSRKKTLNGFLIEAFGRVPKRGEIYHAFGAQFIVEDVSANAIERVHIVKEIG